MGHSIILKPIASYWDIPYIRVAIIALIYFTAARFSLYFIHQPDGIAVIWPPSGIFLSAILLSRRNLRPYLVGALFLADLAAEVMAGIPPVVCVFYSLALAGDATLGSWLLLHFIGNPFTFRKTRDMLGFFGLSMILSNALTSLIAAWASMLIPGISFWNSWFWWAASSGVGSLIITPLILSWGGLKTTELPQWKPKQVAERTVILVFIVLLNLVAFHYLSESNQFGLVLISLNFPFLVWAAFRMDLRGVSLALILVTAIAVQSVLINTTSRMNLYGALFDEVLATQFYLAIMAIPALILVMDISDRKRTERALRENESRYQSLFFDSPISLWEEDFSQIKQYLDELRSQGIGDFEAFFDAHPDELIKCIGMEKILDVNQATMQLLDAKSKEELLTNLVDLSTEDTLLAHKKSILAVAYGETSFDIEVSDKTISDRLINVSLRWVIPTGYEQTYQKAFVSMVDVTRRKKAENDLRESEERFRQLAENIKDVFWINEARTGRIEYVSPAYQRIWGMAPEELYHDFSNWTKAIHPDDKDRVMRAFDDRAAKGSYDCDYRIIKNHQELHWIHDRGFPVFDETGQIRRWVGVAADITERKLTEEAMRKSRQLLSKTFDGLMDAIFILDAKTSAVLDCNRAASSIFGFEIEEMLGQSINFLHVNEAALTDFRRALYQAIETEGSLRAFEFQMKRKNGVIFPTEHNVISLEDETGNRIGWISVVRDITERKQSEIALRESETRYKTLFEESPISLWEEDLSKVKHYIDSLRAGGIEDFRAYFTRHFEAVLECAERIKVIDVNQKTLQLFDATSKEALISGNSGRIKSGRSNEEKFQFFRDELIARAEGHTRFEGESIQYKLSEIPFYASLSIVVAPGFEHTWAKVLVSIIDITDRKRAEEEIRQHIKELNKIRTILSDLTGQFNLQSILNGALQGTLDLTEMEGGLIFLLSDHEQQNLITFAEQNTPVPILQEIQEFPSHNGSTVWEYILKTNPPLITWDTASGCDDPLFASIRHAGMQFFAALSLQAKNQSIGVLGIFTRSEKKPTPQNLGLVSDLCASVVLAIENARLYETTRREAKRSESLARTAARLIAQLDFADVISIVCEEASHALDAPAALLYLYEPKQNVYILGTDYGFPTVFRRAHEQVPQSIYEKLVVQFGDEGGILDLQEMHHFLEIEPFMQPDFRSVIFVPIRHGSDRIGLLFVFSKGQVEEHLHEDQDLIQGLADQASQAIVRARLFEQVSAGRKHLQVLSQQLLEVQEAERRTLALELHDELGQILNSVKMSLDMIPTLPQQVAQDQLRRAQALMGELIMRVRQMSLQLRPSMLDDLGLFPALRWLFKNYQSQTGEVVEFNQSPIDQRYPPQVEITAYRIIQEALTNIIRHAGNKRTRVEIWADERSLNLQVTDFGNGFIPEEALKKYQSSGLSGMRERARLLGGELAVESTPGAGTSISAWLPFLMPSSMDG